MLCLNMIYMIMMIVFAFISGGVAAPVTESPHSDTELANLDTRSVLYNITDRSLLPRGTVLWHYRDSAWQLPNCVPSFSTDHCTGVYHQNYQDATPGNAQVFLYDSRCQLMGSNEDVTYWDMHLGVALPNTSPYFLVISVDVFAKNTDRNFMSYKYHSTQVHHPYETPVLAYDESFIYNKHDPDTGNRGFWHRFTVIC